MASQYRAQKSSLADPGIHTNCLNEANAPLPAEELPGFDPENPDAPIRGYVRSGAEPIKNDTFRQ